LQRCEVGLRLRLGDRQSAYTGEHSIQCEVVRAKLRCVKR
jgi:hypothetical protein